MEEEERMGRAKEFNSYTGVGGRMRNNGMVENVLNEIFHTCDHCTVPTKVISSGKWEVMCD